MEGDHRRVGENVSRLADALAGRQGGSLWSRHEIGIGFPALELYRRTVLGLLMHRSINACNVRICGVFGDVGVLMGRFAFQRFL